MVQESGLAAVVRAEMKPFTMADRKDKPRAPTPNKSSRADAAFDLWLQRGLHALYDEFAEAPIPPEILKLLEDHKDKKDNEK